MKISGYNDSLYGAGMRWYWKVENEVAVIQSPYGGMAVLQKDDAVTIADKSGMLYMNGNIDGFNDDDGELMIDLEGYNILLKNIELLIKHVS